MLVDAAGYTAYSLLIGYCASELFKSYGSRRFLRMGSFGKLCASLR